MDYKRYFNLNEENAKQYVIDHTNFFEHENAQKLKVKEVSDGNINHVYKVSDGKKSLILKQTGETIRTSGNPLDQYRGHIEERCLEIQRKLSGGQVPEVYDYNETMHVILMEDVSNFKNLRYELQKKHIYPKFDEQISNFMVNVLLPTTDLVLESTTKKNLVKEFVNPGTCQISEDLVLTEPYYDYNNRNTFDKRLTDFVTINLYNNDVLKANIGQLRNNFMNNAQALIHGDLHSGSIFINTDDIRVFDSEFAFYGPIGYDIGNVIGNLIFPYVVQKTFQAKFKEDNTEIISWLHETIKNVFDKTFTKLANKYDQIVEFPFYREREFKNQYLRSIKNDTLGYAGTEIIRRTVGDSKVIEITSIENQEIKNLVMKILIKIGIDLILNRKEYNNGTEIILDIDVIIAQIIKQEG
ncbi:S-methyl-5-thioribose kinase [Lactobacillus kullabergensis]|nr:S-methyl-5-thioribose kinase [Lactobacillus kullabergensis]